LDSTRVSQCSTAIAHKPVLQVGQKPPIFPILKRGLRRRCPRCGKGPLFRNFLKLWDRCPVCNLQYQTNFGDTWMFIIILDRVPILFGVAAVYFGYQSTDWRLATLFFVALAVPLFATVRERQGLAIALVYIWRIYLPDPSDEIHESAYYVE
jgi:uncharacterized protein (DUF983 family)